MTKLRIHKINFDIWMNPYISTRLILKGSPQKQNNSKLCTNFSLKNLMLGKDVKMVIAYHKSSPFVKSTKTRNDPRYIEVSL